MNAISTQLPLNANLSAMLDAIAIAAGGDVGARHVQVAEALAPYLGLADLLAGRDCPCNPQRYMRHLLHNNVEAGYAVVAIVWEPGQMSPVHGHRTWCALGVHRGWLAETFFARDGQAVKPTGCTPRGPGAVSHATADLDAIHRLANLGTEEAISIHVYGVGFDDFGEGVNEVYAK